MINDNVDNNIIVVNNDGDVLKANEIIYNITINTLNING